MPPPMDSGSANRAVRVNGQVCRPPIATFHYTTPGGGAATETKNFFPLFIVPLPAVYDGPKKPGAAPEKNSRCGAWLLIGTVMIPVPYPHRPAAKTR